VIKAPTLVLDGEVCVSRRSRLVDRLMQRIRAWELLAD